MPAAEKLTTTVSTKGQVILPDSVRRRRNWPAGTRLVVEERPDGVMLREEPFIKPTRIEDVFGSLHYEGPAKTIEEMDEGVMEEARRRGRD